MAAGFEPSHRREVQPERSSVCHQRPKRSRGGRVPWRLAGLNPLRISRFAAVGCALLAVIMTGNAPANAVVAWRPKAPPLSTPWTHLVGPNNALPEYPRPQMARTHWLNLNGVWDYTGRSGKAVLATLPSENEYHERILVPYPTESALSGIQRHDDQMWYRKVFELPSTWRGQRVLLHFGAVDQIATVWVNNQLVAHHEGGYTEFSADITRALRAGSQQRLTVLVAGPQRDQPIPGRQAAQRAGGAVLYGIVGHLADGVDRTGARRAHRQARHHLGPDRFHNHTKGFRDEKGARRSGRLHAGWRGGGALDRHSGRAAACPGAEPAPVDSR